MKSRLNVPSQCKIYVKKTYSAMNKVGFNIIQILQQHHRLNYISQYFYRLLNNILKVVK